MTQEEFIEILKEEGYSYEIEGDRIVVTDRGYVDLNSLTSLPPGVKFENGRNVYLYDLTSISPGVVFRNGGDVYLNSLTSISPGVEFRNDGDVDLSALIGGYSAEWKGNIEGIRPNRILNAMIKQGLFER